MIPSEDRRERNEDVEVLRRAEDHREYAESVVAPSGVRPLYVALAVAVLVALIGVVFYLGSAATDTLRQDEAGGCYRLNVLRAADNSSHYQDYIFDSAISTFLRRQATRGRGSEAALSALLHDPRIAGDVGALRIVGLFATSFSETNTVGGLAVQAQTIVDSKTWVPLTDCRAAIDNPSAYCPADRIRFRDRIPPPNEMATPSAAGVRDSRFSCGRKRVGP